jgi:glycosyl transferase family 25
MPLSEVLPPSWPVFVISLRDAVERRLTLQAQCVKLGIDPVIIDAVDGRGGLPFEWEPFVNRAAVQDVIGRRASDGELACALSHQLIYRRITDEGLPGAVILEDDAILTPMFGDFILHRGYLKADLVQLDHLGARVFYQRRYQFSEQIMLIPLAINTSLTTGYSISLKGSRYILDHSTPLGGLADWPCDILPLAPLAASPRIVDHPPVNAGGSTLEKERQILARPKESPRKGWKRFLVRAYWKHWWLKRRTRAIS